MLSVLQNIDKITAHSTFRFKCQLRHENVKSNLDTNKNILNECRYRNIGVIELEEYDDEYQVGKCDGI